MPRSPLFLASVATALVAAALLAVYGESGHYDLVALGLGFLLFFGLSFVASVAVICIIGIPAARLLNRLGWTSRLAFVLAGMVLPLPVIGAYLIYDWCCIEPGPFRASFQERIQFLGASAVVWSYARAGGFAAICGAVAANFYWVAQHGARSNTSLERTRER